MELTIPLSTFATMLILYALYADDGLSDDAIEPFQPPVTLPAPELGNLPDIEQVMRAASTTPAGRDSLSKFLISEEYIPKLLPLVSVAEDLESLTDLHRLCNIMKTLILLNDTAIIEYVVTDEVILGVVGALECELILFRTGSSRGANLHRR
jgi:protein phosphatase-4 regulatory subunit 3